MEKETFVNDWDNIPESDVKSYYDDIVADWQIEEYKNNNYEQIY